jgi:hypothetical protein
VLFKFGFFSGEGGGAQSCWRIARTSDWCSPFQTYQNVSFFFFQKYVFGLNVSLELIRNPIISAYLLWVCSRSLYMAVFTWFVLPKVLNFFVKLKAKKNSSFVLVLCHFPTKTLIYLLGHLFSSVLRKEYLGKLSSSGIPIEKETQFYDTQPCKLQKRVQHDIRKHLLPYYKIDPSPAPLRWWAASVKGPAVLATMKLSGYLYP